MQYTVAKKKFSMDDIECIKLIFDNNNYVSLAGEELVDFSLNLYDRLIWHNNGFSPVVESGFLRFKVSNRKNPLSLGEFVHDPKELAKGRKAYVENRCVNVGGIRLVKLFDEYNWEVNLFGCITAKMDGEYLVLQYLPQPNMSSADGLNHVASINSVSGDIISSINLDFENCESFTVYRNEILDIQLNFEERLEWSSSNIYRKVKSGYIILKLDSTYMTNRKVYLFAEDKVTVKRLQQRLCGKKGVRAHDICHLYVHYVWPNYVECIEIDDIKPDEEIERLEKLEEETCSNMFYFEGGYSQKVPGGYIVITFGRNADKTLAKLTQTE